MEFIRVLFRSWQQSGAKLLHRAEICRGGGQVRDLAQRQDDPLPGRGDAAHRHLGRDRRTRARRTGRKHRASAARRQAARTVRGAGAMNLDGIHPAWVWLIAAAVLGIAALLMPGIFLIWLAAAAAITGFATLLFYLPAP